MKRIVCILTIIAMIFILAGCTEYHYDQMGDFGIGYSASNNKAYVGGYSYDLTKSSTDIVIPEEYNGIPITKLGGYFGLGVPTPFGVDFVHESFPDYESVELISSPKIDMIYDIIDVKKTEIIYIDFTIYVSKNIEEFVYTSLNRCTFVEYSSECECSEEEFCEICEGGLERTITYIPRFYINCDEDNKVFYASEGKLYKRADSSLVEEINYFDYTVIDS